MHMLSSQHSELFDEKALHKVIETLKKDEDRVVALPRAALHLIESVSSHLKTFRENRDLTEVREALSEALAEQQKRILNGEQGLSIEHLKQKVSNLEKMDAQKREQLNALWKIRDKIKQVAFEAIHEAHKDRPNKKSILLAFQITIPALKALYERKKTEYGTEFMDKVTTELIQHIFEERKADCQKALGKVS
jgi:uncharacterized protein (UPF0335 family)